MKIIKTKRSPCMCFVDSTLTAIAWLGFLYLIISQVTNITAIPILSKLLVFIATAIIIVAWAHIKCASKKQAQQRLSYDLKKERVAEQFHLSIQEIDQIQHSRRTVLYQSMDGLIVHILTGTQALHNLTELSETTKENAA